MTPSPSLQGFPDVAEIKRALRLAKNDLNEAVAILTNEQVRPKKLHTAQQTLLTAQYTLLTAHCTLLTAYCPLLTTRCTINPSTQPLSSYGTVDDLSLDVDMKYQATQVL